MSFLAVYTIVHVVISLVGIGSGLIVVFGLLAGERLDGQTVLFLATTVAVLALHLNVFVLIVQLFRNVPALHLLAPTQSEPPFGVAQLVVLVLFFALGTLAVRRSKTI